MNTENDEKTDLQSFLVCLHYLCKEAERAKLPAVFSILQNAITEIGEWSDGNAPNIKYNILDHSLYYALEFLSKFSSLSKDKQEAMSHIFDSTGGTKMENFEEMTVQ